MHKDTLNNVIRFRCPIIFNEIYSTKSVFFMCYSLFA